MKDTRTSHTRRINTNMNLLVSTFHLSDFCSVLLLFVFLQRTAVHDDPSALPRQILHKVYIILQ